MKIFWVLAVIFITVDAGRIFKQNYDKGHPMISPHFCYSKDGSCSEMRKINKLFRPLPTSMKRSDIKENNIYRDDFYSDNEITEDELTAFWKMLYSI